MSTLADAMLAAMRERLRVCAAAGDMAGAAALRRQIRQYQHASGAHDGSG